MVLNVTPETVQKVRDNFNKPSKIDRLFHMSPNQVIKVKGGDSIFSKNCRLRKMNNWESFKHTNSVNKHAIVKDVTVVTPTMVKKEIQQYIKVRVETRFNRNGFEMREIPKPEDGKEQLKTIICYGIRHSLRSDGVYREVGTGNNIPKIVFKRKHDKEETEKEPGELKSVVMAYNGIFKKYKIVRKGKK